MRVADDEGGVVSTEVVIADTGGANVASLRFAFERLGARAYVSADGATIASAERVVLPGVGAAGHAMERLRAAGLINVLRTLTQPVLGICLGMQLLFRQSAEGATRCLNLVPGTVQSLEPAPGRPVPHMGWNELKWLKADPLLEGIAERQYAYFVHSYAAGISEYTLAAAEYGAPLSAVIRRHNFYGAQFHPERSGKTGARLLENFLGL
jgi:imidazole glycerol-phosphate synthase subunit HisH